MNFHRDFHAYRWIRGQEYDPYVSAPLKRNLNDYLNENFPEQWRNRISQFLANTDQFAGPKDWFPHKVVDEAAEWLEDNRPHEKIFLWIDSFDPMNRGIRRIRGIPIPIRTIVVHVLLCRWVAWQVIGQVMPRLSTSKGFTPVRRLCGPLSWATL